MATVVIWENNMSAREGTGRWWSGHSALCLTDQWSAAGAGSQYDHYLSWYPGDDETNLFKRASHPKKNVVEDIQYQGYSPDWIIRLPAGAANVANMQAAWAAQRGNVVPNSGGLRNTNYGFIRNNCSTMVARIMIAGGLNPRRNYKVWSPVRVKDFALHVGGNAMTWEDLKTELRGQGLADTDRSNANGTIIDWARDEGFCHSGAQGMFSRGGRCGAWTNDAGQTVVQFEALDINAT